MVGRLQVQERRGEERQTGDGGAVVVVAWSAPINLLGLILLESVTTRPAQWGVFFFLAHVN